MSSYLNFYIVPKVEEQQEVKPIHLICYSRNTDVYQYFNDVLHITYIGLDVIQYTELTTEMVDRVLESLKNDISNSEKRIAEYEKHAGGNSEIIETIIEQKEYVEDLQWSLHKIEFIKDLVVEAASNYGDYNKILCNIG